MEQYYTFLCQTPVVVTLAYLWGLSQNVKIHRSFFNNPLMSILNSIPEAFLYSVGTIFLCDFLPNNLQGIISCSLIVAITIMKVRELCEYIKPYQNNSVDNNFVQQSVAVIAIMVIFAMIKFFF